MVYGLNVKPEHGYYVEVDTLDGDIKAIEVADPTPDDGLPFVGPVGQAYTMGRHVRTEHVPTRMQWGDLHGHAVPDFDNGLILNVSARARDLIERFERGVHQFIPVDYFNRKGEMIEQRYFLILGNRIDSVDREHSRMRLVKGMMWTSNDVEDPKLVFSAAQSRGYHLWCDKHLEGGQYISDEFGEACIAEGLTGLRLHRADTV